MLKGGVEEVRSTVTGLTDLANLKSSYAPGCLAVVRMEHKIWFYCVFATIAGCGKLGLDAHTS